MSSKMNKAAYVSLIEENIEWLRMAEIAYNEKYPEANRGKLEAEHIERILQHSIKTEYEKKKRYNPPGTLVFKPQIATACNKIIEHPNANDKDKEFADGVMKFGYNRKFISEKQASYLGSIYVRVVNNGVVNRNDWW